MAIDNHAGMNVAAMPVMNGSSTSI